MISVLRLEKTLSCRIKINKEDGIAWILHLNVIKNVKTKFGNEAMAMQGHGTAETLRIKIVRCSDDDKITIASQS
jgi:hypothetical protein